MKPKAMLRWATVLLFGGVGVYLLGAGFWEIIRHSSHDWVSVVFGLVFLLIFTSLPLAAACFAYLRQYRRLAKLAAVVGAFFLLGAVAYLIQLLGGDQWRLRDSASGPGWKDLLGIALGLAPLGTAVAFLRWATVAVDRYLPEPAPTAEQQARALLWQRRMLPPRRVMLRIGMALAELMVWAAVLAFLGALVWVWQASSALERTDEWGRDAFGLSLIVMVASLLVFLVSWLVRGGWRSRLREMSAAND